MATMRDERTDAQKRGMKIYKATKLCSIWVAGIIVMLVFLGVSQLDISQYAKAAILVSIGIISLILSRKMSKGATEAKRKLLNGEF